MTDLTSQLANAIKFLLCFGPSEAAGFNPQSAEVCGRQGGVGETRKHEMSIVQQLGGLFLSAVPTAILVFLFYLFLRWAFFKPLLQVVAKRRAQIEGAQREAEAIEATVEEKQRAYREALRKAQLDLFAEQEAARRAALEERAQMIREARARATAEVQAAKRRLAEEIDSAQKVLEASAQQLAEEVARAILEPAGEAR